MNKFKATKQILALTTILAIASIVFYVLFFNALKNKNEEISLILNVTDTAIQRELKLRSVGEIIKDTEDEREKLDTYFVADDHVVDFIESIEELGRYVGVDIETVSVNINDNLKTKDSISEILNLSIETRGDWEDVFYFLALMEKMPFRIDIANADLYAVYRNDGKDTSVSWKGFFNINVFKLK